MESRQQSVSNDKFEGSNQLNLTAHLEDFVSVESRESFIQVPDPSSGPVSLFPSGVQLCCHSSASCSTSGGGFLLNAGTGVRVWCLWFFDPLGSLGGLAWNYHLTTLVWVRGKCYPGREVGWFSHIW